MGVGMGGAGYQLALRRDPAARRPIMTDEVTDTVTAKASRSGAPRVHHQ